MRAGLVATIVLIALSSGCGRSAGQSAGGGSAFLGLWYGLGTRTDTALDGTTGSSTEGKRFTIVSAGPNSLRLPQFCSESDPGPGANVNTDAQFTIQPYSCSIGGTACTGTMNIEGGTGTLQGDTLTVTYRGSVRHSADGGCPLGDLRFTTTLNATHRAQVFPPAAPGNVRATPYEFFGWYLLSLDELDPDVYFYEAELKVGDGDWTAITVYDGLQIQIDPFKGQPLPELTTLGLRVRGLRGSSASDWSTPIFFNSTLRPAFNIRTVTSRGRVEFAFVPRPDVDALVFERAEPRSSSWSVIGSVDTTARSFVDLTAVEDTTHAYRARWRAQGIDGFPAGLGDIAAPLLAPSNVTATPGQGRVDLAWKNNSHLATEVVILRSENGADDGPFTALAYLYPDVTTFSDVAAPPGPHVYRIEARSPGSVPGGTGVPLVVPPPTGSGTWTAELTELDRRPDDAVIDSAGRLLTSSAGLLDRSDHPAWAPYPINAGGPALRGDGLRFDAAGTLHVVYTRRIDPENPLFLVAVLHDWLENETWHTEELTRGSNLLLAYDLDPGGRPVLAGFMPGDGAVVRVLSPGPTGYREETVRTPLDGGSYSEALWLAVASDGVKHVIAQNEITVHASWNGTWSSEAVPLDIGNIFVRDLPELRGVLPTVGGTLSLVTYTYADGTLSVMLRDGSGWGPLAPMLKPVGEYNAPLSARSLDGRRAAVLFNAPGGVHFAELADGWTPHLLAGAADFLGFHFDANQRLVVILGVGTTVPSNQLRVAVYRQQ